MHWRIEQELVRQQREAEDAAVFEGAARLREGAAEDVSCFITFLGLDDDAALGLGVHIHSCSALQRRLRLPPELDIVGDYLDVEAFNEGVQRSAPPAWDSEETTELPSMTSSTRRRLNGWLPLYVNSSHWARSGPYAASAISYLAHGRPVAKLRAKDALNVCCRLLTCAVVGFTKGQTEGASARAAKRGKASEKAVQMYADVHRLFLQFALERPEVQELARKRLHGFIRDPAGRTRARVSSLGDLVQCLLIVEDISWEDLAPTIIPEALRRHVSRRAWEGHTFDSQHTFGNTVEELIGAWDDFAPQSGMVLSFCALFLQMIGRPAGRSLDEVRAAYDLSWGRLREEDMRDVVDACAHFVKGKSVMDFVPLILPSVKCRPGHLGEFFLWAEKYGRQRATACIGELVLWAERYGHVAAAEVVPATSWPNLDGPYPRLRQWQAAFRQFDLRWKGREWAAWLSQQQSQEAPFADELALATRQEHLQRALQPQLQWHQPEMGSWWMNWSTYGQHDLFTHSAMHGSAAPFVTVYG